MPSNHRRQPTDRRKDQSMDPGKHEYNLEIDP